MRKLSLVTSLVIFIVVSSVAQKTILHCGKLVDVTNSKVLTNYSVVIQGNKIIEIKEGL